MLRPPSPKGEGRDKGRAGRQPRDGNGPASGPRRVLGAASALIGHAMPAAGMAGLIKAALALYHRVLPISPGAEAPHPLLARADSPLALNPAT
ncbi:MAG: hypothetical protein IRY99_15785, partial [Isosphaeraceae bacterium]|nr:hypothetical protein [Isosphaeraceae bacterium]